MRLDGSAAWLNRGVVSVIGGGSLPSPRKEKKKKKPPHKQWLVRLDMRRKKKPLAFRARGGHVVGVGTMGLDAGAVVTALPPSLLSLSSVIPTHHR